MSINIEVLPRIPARVTGTDGITIAKSNGSMVVGFDYATSGFGAELQQAVDTANGAATTAAASSAAATSSAADAAAAAGALTIATQPEAEEGVINDRGMSPLRVSQNVNIRAPYKTVADATASTIPSDRDWVKTLGMDALGNEAPSLWTETNTAPTDGACFTDAGGRIFDIFVKATPPNLMQFGGSYYATDDNTAALQKMLSVCKRQNLQWCQIPPGDFIFGSWPGDLGDYNVFIEGAGRDRTKLYRGYNEGIDDRGLLHFSNGRVKLSGMTILPKSGNTGGSAITLYTTDTTQVDTATLEDIRITSGTVDGWRIGLNIDGQYKTTGAVGVRNTNIDYLEIFGCELYAARIISCTLLSWMGGFTSSNVGTGEVASGDILIGGISSVPAHYFNLNLAAIVGDLLLQDYAQVGTITCPHFGGDIINTANVSTVMTIGNVSGIVQTNWQNSQHVNMIRNNSTDGTWTWRDLGNNEYEIWRSASLTTSSQDFNFPAGFTVGVVLHTFFAPLTTIKVGLSAITTKMTAVADASGTCIIGARVLRG